jgi:type II secretory pathway pseudopilin PulG
VIRVKRGGFVLIEIVAVLLVLAIIVAVLISRAGGNVSAEAEADILRSHLRYAQARAMADSVSWGIAAAAHSYTLQRDCAEALTSLPGEESAVRLLPSDVTLSPMTIVFSPSRGIPITSCASPDALAENVVIIVAARGAVATVEVTRITGFVP